MRLSILVVHKDEDRQRGRNSVLQVFFFFLEKKEKNLALQLNYISNIILNWSWLWQEIQATAN